jgi:hypothetical protein
VVIVANFLGIDGLFSLEIIARIRGVIILLV